MKLNVEDGGSRRFILCINSHDVLFSGEQNRLLQKLKIQIKIILNIIFSVTGVNNELKTFSTQGHGDASNGHGRKTRDVIFKSRTGSGKTNHFMSEYLKGNGKSVLCGLHWEGEFRRTEQD